MGEAGFGSIAGPHVGAVLADAGTDAAYAGTDAASAGTDADYVGTDVDVDTCAVSAKVWLISSS